MIEKPPEMRRFIVLEEESPRWFVYDTWLDRPKAGAFKNKYGAAIKAVHMNAVQKQLNRAAKATEAAA